MDGGAAPHGIEVAPRRRFTSAEVERMVETGILSPDERLELIHGDIIDMGKEGTAHWRARQKLISWLLRRLSPDIDLAPDGPLRLSKHDEPEPDFYLFPTAMDVNDVRGSDVLLAVEIADSSFVKDREIKGPLYSDHGVREYWIVAIEAKTTYIIAFQAAATAPRNRSHSTRPSRSRGSQNLSSSETWFCHADRLRIPAAAIRKMAQKSATKSAGMRAPMS